MSKTVILPPPVLDNIKFDGSGNVIHFLELFENLCDDYSWTDDKKKCQKLFPYLRDAALDCYKQYFADNATTGGITESEIWDNTKNSNVPTWAKFKKYFKEAFDNKETPESIERRLNNNKYEKFDSAAEYVFTMLRLMHRLDPDMAMARKVRYLCKGLPPALGKDVYLQEPADTAAVLKKLEQYERYTQMIDKQEGNTLEQTDTLLKAIQEIKDEVNTFIQKGNTNDTRKNNEQMNNNNNQGQQYNFRGNRRNFRGRRGNFNRGYNRNFGRGNHNNRQSSPVIVVQPYPAQSTYSSRGYNNYRGRGNRRGGGGRGGYNNNRGGSYNNAYNNNSQGGGNNYVENASRNNAEQRKCYNCNLIGHIARNCPYKEN